MTMTEASNSLATVDDASLERFALAFAEELTVDARDAYAASPVESARRLRDVNESLHRLLAAARLAHEGTTDAARDMIAAQAADQPETGAYARALKHLHA